MALSNVDVIIQYFDSETEITKEDEEQLKIYFSKELNCRDFLSKCGFRLVVENLHKKNKLIALNTILPFIRTETLLSSLDSLITEDISAIIDMITVSNLPPEQNITLIYLIFQGIQKIYKTRPTIIKDLTDSFNKYDEYIKTASIPILELYGYLINCSPKGISWEMYNHLNKIYMDKECKSKCRTFILELLNNEKLFTETDAKIEHWIIPDILESEDCFRAFTSVANLYIANIITNSKRIVEFLTSNIIPPIKENICTEQILKYLLSLIVETKLTSDQFGDERFIQLIFDNQTPEELSNYLMNTKGILPLLKELFNSKRCNWSKGKTVDRLIDTLEHDKDNILTDFVFPIFTDNFCLSIVKTLLIHISNDKVFNYCKKYNSEEPGFYPYFSKFDCFSGLPFENIVFSMNFLLLMKDYVLEYNDHSFDDFVLKEPISSPVFKISRYVISKFLPEDEFSPLIFPSLLPFVDFNITTSLPSNKYLIGYYSIKVFHKLGNNLFDIKNLKQYISRYIRTSDALYLLEQDYVKSVGLLSRTTEYGLYEFHSSLCKSYATFPTNLSSIVFQLFIEREQKDYPLFTISGEQFILKKDNILYIKRKKIVEIKSKTWMTIGIFKSDRSIDIYFDSQLATHINSRSIELTIGSKDQDNSGIFYLSECIAYNIPPSQLKSKTLDLKPSTIIEMKGNTIYVPCQSFNSIFFDKGNLQYLFDKIFETEDKKVIGFQLSFISQLPLFSKSLSDWFFKKFKRSLVSSIEKLDLSFLMLYAACCISSSDNSEEVSNRLSILVNDYNLWNICNHDLLKEFIKSLMSMLLNVKTFNWDIFYKNISELFFFILSNQSFNDLENSIFDFFNVILNNCCDNNSFRDFLQKTLSFNLLCKNFDRILTKELLINPDNNVKNEVNTNKSEIISKSEILMPTSEDEDNGCLLQSDMRFSELQEKLLRMVINIQSSKKSDLIRNHFRAYLSLHVSDGMKKKLLFTILEDEKFVSENLPIVIRGLQKVATDQSMWNKILTFLCRKEVTVDKCGKITSPHSLSIFLSLFRILFESKDEIFLLFISSIFSSNDFNFHALFTYPTFGYLVELFTNKDIDITYEEFHNVDQLCQQDQQYIQIKNNYQFINFLIHKTKDKTTNESLDLQSDSSFANIDNKLSNMENLSKSEANFINSDSIHPPSISVSEPHLVFDNKEKRNLSQLYIQNCVKFISNFSIRLLTSDEKNFSLFMKTVILYGHKEITSKFISNVINLIWNSNDKYIKLYSDSLSFFYYNKKEEFYESNIINTLEDKLLNYPNKTKFFINNFREIYNDSNINKQIELQRIVASVQEFTVELFLFVLVVLRSKNIDASFNHLFFKKFQQKVSEWIHDEEFVHLTKNSNSFEDIISFDFNKFNNEFDIIEKRKSNKGDLCNLKTSAVFNEIRFLSFLYDFNEKISEYGITFFVSFYKNINFYNRKEEKHCIHYLQRKYSYLFSDVFSEEELNERTHSYFVSHLCLPIYFRMLISRSPFRLPHPTEEKYQIRNVIPLFGFSEITNYSYKLSEYIPNYLVQYPFVVHEETTNKMKLFEEIYKIDENRTIQNCIFVRVDIRMKCIAIKKKTSIIILIGAEYVNDDIIFETPNPLFFDSLIQISLLKEIGKCSFFLGRVVLIVDDILQIEKHVILSNPYSITVYSTTGSSFILEFYEEPIFEEIYKIKEFCLNKKEVFETWKQNKISTFDFLYQINLLGQRSTLDLSGYPIYPRIVKDMNKKYSFENRRDLSVVVQTSFDKTVQEDKLNKIYKMHKYHHSENLSNSIFVCMLNVRYSPFCLSLWELNDGWDKGDRVFRSIPFHLSVKQKTTLEITPDMYCFCELFDNKNNFDSLILEFPTWCKNSVDFIERHRSILESQTKTDIISWIDLVFGHKQTSIESFNVFNPLSYPVIDIDTNNNNNNSNFNFVDNQRHTWMMNCGSVPIQVFDQQIHIENNQQRYQYPSLSPEEYIDRSDVFVRYSLQRHSIDLYYQGCIVYSQHMKDVKSILLCENKLYFCVNTYDDYVHFYNITYNEHNKRATSFRFINKHHFDDVMFSIISKKEILVCTCTRNKVYFWCPSTSHVEHVLNLSCNCAFFDDEVGCIIFGTDVSVLFYTYNCTFIRSISTQSRVDCLLTCGHFSVSHRYLYIGNDDGFVICYECVEPDHSLFIMSADYVSNSPVTFLLYDEHTNTIHYK
ncbi:Beige/BEACH domain containing protein [Trichomonas vaginalis G3]|uniref:Beige/BEACH domain containing protein n=1 Tax=Trichomonas vaginalis (strain ATCC PRA-98 / G3) TaxID=412133 RepID=A2EM55_TRIV3|nr:aggrephagy protein [Trichomonas vaginalis G3]EAY06239.1 Beige/BEACH domain containing protein [Trichomonas vaginalis G3]KAI5505180.1 aggrephagy protein [Trichomonas vaginalis G3]|eukprot:XP_001318462.1 Beige/BEACH domain containing protein [Trichomonas vaginalis G3]